MIIIGITGTIGAGKGAVVDYLTNTHNFKHHSVRNFLIKEIEKRNLPIDRDSMTLVANDLRAKFGSGYIAEELFKESVIEDHDAIIESLRTVGEIELLKNKAKQGAGKFCLFAVDAPVEVRYDRIYKRGSSTDNVTFEKFLEDEKREMESLDPTKQNLKACIEMADFVFYNDATLDDLYKKVDEVLERIK
jgi:dephospho-CoA kinase